MASASIIAKPIYPTGSFIFWLRANARRACSPRGTTADTDRPPTGNAPLPRRAQPKAVIRLIALHGQIVGSVARKHHSARPHGKSVAGPLQNVSTVIRLKEQAERTLASAGTTRALPTMAASAEVLGHAPHQSGPSAETKPPSEGCGRSAASSARSILRTVSTVTRELPRPNLTTVFSASPEASATRVHGKPLASKRARTLDTVRSIIMPNGLPHFNEVRNEAFYDEVALKPSASQKCGMSSDELRDNIHRFMHKRGLKPYPWAAHCKLAPGTLQAFLKGTTKALTTSTQDRLLVGAREILNDSCISHADIFGAGSVGPALDEELPIGERILDALRELISVSRENNEMLKRAETRQAPQPRRAG